MKQILTIGTLAALCLTGCQDTKRALGFEKSTPDAYRVVSQEPHSMPPEYHLRPPRPGAPRPQKRQALDKAQETLIGDRTQPRGTASEAEQLFLRRAGANEAPKDIRSVIDKENQQDTLVENEEGFWDKLMEGTLIYDKDTKTKQDILDPVEEMERLQSETSKETGPVDGME